VSVEKFSQIFLPRLCQNHVFHTVSYRGAKSIFPRVRSPPPFLGSQEKSTALRGSGARWTARQAERETPFSQLSARDLASLAATDEYFLDEYAFGVLGETVTVSDCELAEALKELPADRRDIVLLSYFFDMTDREIAERLKPARRIAGQAHSKS
jgi:hypothetical protein